MRLFKVSILLCAAAIACAKQQTGGGGGSGGGGAAGGATGSSVTGGRTGGSGAGGVTGGGGTTSTSNSGGSAAGGTSGGGTAGAAAGGATGGSGNSSTSSSGGAGGSGGATVTGGTTKTGGAGGSSATAGSGGSGGTAGAGGSSATASSGGSGGTPSAGGSGGTAGVGGTTSKGGSGGSSGAGGTGGSSGTAGTGGSGSTAGATGSGGSAGTGGTAGTGSLQGFACSIINGTSTQQLFTSWYTTWSAKYYVTCGTDLARIKGCNGDDNTCSEGMGYGMLLSVAAGDQTAFDRLNRFRKALGAEYNKAYTSGGLMAWNSGNTCPPSASGGNANNAPDGDLDAAMALVQASKRWPTGTYKDDALALIDGIWANNIGTSGSNPYLGAGTVNLKDKSFMSYWTLGYFQVFARFVTDATKQQNWKGLATRGYTLLKTIQANPACNGEFPESVQIDGTLWNGDPCDFGYDSCRVPWRLATDYAWFGTADSKTMLDSLRTNVVKGNPVTSARQQNSAFVGGLALSGVSADQATMNDFCKKWVDAKTAGGSYDDNPYFQNTLAVLYLLVAGGLFDRVVTP
jgi:endo-1,4-beta-D-glucanase Y